jgi:hypothetical protein
VEKPNYWPVISLCSTTAKADVFSGAARTLSALVLFLSASNFNLAKITEFKPNTK